MLWSGRVIRTRLHREWCFGMGLVVVFFAAGESAEAQTVRKAFLHTLHAFQAEKVQAASVGRVSEDFWQKSEPAQLMLGMITLYQQLIASQDAPACNFTPSCSRFGQAALARAGLVKGLLLTSDRLQRCNGLPGRERFYPVDHSTHRFYDPIDVYLTLTPAKEKGSHDHSH